MEKVKFRIGDYIYSLTLEQINDNKIRVRFPYNAILVNEVKSCFEGSRWNPDGKYWTIDSPNISQHNQFQLDYLKGNKPSPYTHYDRTLIDYKSKRSLYEFQLEGVRFAITRMRCILAMEPGLGKSLIAIEALEYLKQAGIISNSNQVLWAGPRSGLVAVNLELRKWGTQFRPDLVTYESLKNIASNSSKLGKYKVVIYDEAHKLKTPTAQRSQAGKYIADRIREEEGMVLLMTGSPSPKSPVDWWNLAHIACPGFLREGSIRRFQERLGLVRTEESLSGGMYPKLVTWWDNENKCQVCGKFRDDFNHDTMAIMPNQEASYSIHKFKESKNEVQYLYRRLSGLVLVKFKSECLSFLPEKIFKRIELKPTQSVLRAAKLIGATSKTTIQALTMWRELSDGFQYKEIESDKITCQLCKGRKIINQPLYIGPEELANERRLDKEDYWKTEEQACPNCNGTGYQYKSERTVVEVPCPKEDAIIDLLEEYENIGRVVIYGGFTATIDRLIRIVTKAGWNYIKVDGRGWQTNLGISKSDSEEMIKLFQDKSKMVEKIAYIAHPGSGGVALTLTASPVEIYYSNDFNAEYRIQSLERAHRIGMDVNRGLLIIDLIHLETDKKVLENLDKKVDLQSLTMGDFSKVLDEQSKEVGGVRYF